MDIARIPHGRLFTWAEESEQGQPAPTWATRMGPWVLEFKCFACGRWFYPRRADQKFCPEKDCTRARRRPIERESKRRRRASDSL